MPEQKLESIVQITPKIPNRPGAKCVLLSYGPFKLKAAGVSTSNSQTEAAHKTLTNNQSNTTYGNTPSMDPPRTSWTFMTASDFPRGITILGGGTRVIYKDNTAISLELGVYIHHLANANMDQKMPTIISCPKKKNSPASNFQVRQSS